MFRFPMTAASKLSRTGCPCGTARSTLLMPPSRAPCRGRVNPNLEQTCTPVELWIAPPDAKGTTYPEPLGEA